MGVMMIMRAAPYTAGAQCPHAERAHENFRHMRFGQDGMMLLIVIDDEQTQGQQTPKNAETKSYPKGHFTGILPAGQGHDRGNGQKKGGREDIPPTSNAIVLGVCLGAGKKSLGGNH